MMQIAIPNSGALSEAGLDEQLFEAPPVRALHGLVMRAEVMRAAIERVGDFLAGPDMSAAFHYFHEAARREEHRLPSQAKLLDRAGALAALDAECWNSAMRLTDVLDWMPAARRNELLAQIRDFKAPEFTAESVQVMIVDLLTRRGEFLAEMVDGIFEGLSRRHKTNDPRGFGERMILQYVYNEWGSPSHGGTPSMIHDLRCVIGKLMGRGAPGWGSTDQILRDAKAAAGAWIEADGGAIRIRGYKVGTAHLEVHPDVAWKLNAILALSRPNTLADVDRKPPKRSARRPWRLFGRPLPFPVLEAIAESIPRDGECVYISSTVDDKIAEEAAAVLVLLGGVVDQAAGGKAGRSVRFQYQPRSVLQEVVSTGTIPDRVAHQYYPTPAALADRVVAIAMIGQGERVLEPSAGTGSLVDAVRRAVPSARIQCAEVSDLFCRVLESKGCHVHHGDFLDIEPTVQHGADVVLMNPPFSAGRWRAHVEHAARFVRPGGRLVAILPWNEAAPRLDVGLSLTGWSGPIQYPDVSIEVGIAAYSAATP